MFLRFLEQCRIVFPFKNSQGYYYMATEKVHGMIHNPNDIARFCHYLNSSCEAPETGHKKWVGRQGKKQTRVMRFNWPWCFIPYVKNAVPCYVRLFKVVFFFIVLICFRLLMIVILLSKDRWQWSCFWKRSLEEENETMWSRGTAQSRPLVLQKNGWRKRRTWTIRCVKYAVT